MDVDPTDSWEWRMEQADRLMAWEFVHSLACAGKQLPAYILADRVGLTTSEMDRLVKTSISHLADGLEL